LAVVTGSGIVIRGEGEVRSLRKLKAMQGA
jgi:hypothetical protein